MPLNKLMRLKHIENLFKIQSFGTPQLDTQLALTVADETGGVPGTGTAETAETF